jgi:hypothetical protein
MECEDHSSCSFFWTQTMAGPAQSGVLIYAMNLDLVPLF